MKRYEWQDGGDACEHSEGPWVRYDDARAVIDGLQALLNERDEKLGNFKACSAEFCEDLGKPRDERPAFEAWCAGQCGLSLAPKQHPLRGVLEPRSYQQPAVQMAWAGWQARAALK